MKPAPPTASEVRIRLPRLPSDWTASRRTQQSPALGEAWWREDQLWATTAPTPEAGGVRSGCVSCGILPDDEPEAQYEGNGAADDRERTVEGAAATTITDRRGA